MLTKCRLIFLISILFVTIGVSNGQNRFEGYSLTVEADIGGSCPIHYLPSTGNGNAVDVYYAGTNQRLPATGLTPCDGGDVHNGNKVVTNGDGHWCFTGHEDFYDIKLQNGTTYLWYPITKNSGVYNVKDFRPVTRSSGPTPVYTFIDPPDYTSTIKNAVAFVAARQGGTLQFPDGDYIVGTTDGNTRDPNFQAITLTSGINIVGAGSNGSIPTTNLPSRRTPTRIRLRNPNQSIFRIGGCTDQVTIRNVELLGNTALYAEAPRDPTGDYGIEGMGKWAINPATHENTSHSSQIFKFENVTFQSLDKGIFVHNANDANCNPRDQACFQWQFDYVKIDHGIFINNKTGIWIDTGNTDWKISNSVFYYIKANAPGDGIHIQRGGTMLIEQSFGGGYDYGGLIGGTFIYVDTISSLAVINSASERDSRSLYMNPAGATTSVMLNMIGNTFFDKIELGGRVNYVSSGNFYGPKTIQADASTTITSTGDHFCYDPLVFPNGCKDEKGNQVTAPGFGNARVMFQTGRLAEGSGSERIDAQPNHFGYNVEISDGLMQFDPNITFRDITNWATAIDRPHLSDGAMVYCKDCRKAPTGLCTQGTVVTDGAFAKRINGQWRCD